MYVMIAMIAILAIIARIAMISIMAMIAITAKPSVDFKSGLLNSRPCTLTHRLIKAESPNLQLNYSSWPSAFLPRLNPVLKIVVVLIAF